MLQRPTTLESPFRSTFGFLLVVTLSLFGAHAAEAQSRVGSRTGSAALAEGSALIAGGSAELLSTAGSLVITGVQTSTRGVRLVLRPVGTGLSHGAELSADVTIEISLAAWDAARTASRVSGRALEHSLVAVGDVLEVVVIHAAGASVGATMVVGSALVVSGMVVAVIAHEGLEVLLGHRVRP